MTTISCRRFLVLIPLAAFAVVLPTATVPQGSAFAAGPRVLPYDKLPDDWRLAPLKDLNGYFPFSPSPDREAWARRAERVRRQMLVSLGLWPMPSRTPLEAVVHGKIDRGDYTVEKAYFQSYPGFFVTGNLYRPKDPGTGKPRNGRRPGVLCPHGHWASGRFYDKGEQGVRKEIEQGAEKFEEGGRSPLQSRCVQLARMGCVVFHYDMIGYADCTQISFQLAHRFAKQRPEMNAAENWGLFSPQAESHAQSVMGMQTYDSIRALDFLSSLPDVDAERIAVTGASGGGTQTFIVCALDPRPAVAFPAVMVSTAMQGGCTCENACGLRVGTGNVEFAALFSPRPLGLSAANDWTKEMETKGFPQLQQHYEMLGAKGLVMLKPLLHFGHNYNYVSRAAMYCWMNKHLGLGHDEPIVEPDYQRLTPEEMTVWDNDKHPRPEGGDDFERKLLNWMTDDAAGQLAALTPHDAPSLAKYRDTVGRAIEVLIGRGLPEAADVTLQQAETADRGDYRQTVGLLRHTLADERTERLPIVLLEPNDSSAAAKGRAVVWLDEAGKAGLFDASGTPRREIRKLLAAGATVVGVDLLFQGEFLADGKPIVRTRRVANTRESAAYTFGYNHTLFARRVHDVLSTIALLQGREPAPVAVDLVGLGKSGPLAAATRAVAGGAIDRAVIDTGGFRFGKLSDIHDVDFLPGGAKYFDLPGMLSLSAPHKLWITGEGDQPPKIVKAAYEAACAEKNIVAFAGSPGDEADAAVKWLLVVGNPRGVQ